MLVAAVRREARAHPCEGGVVSDMVLGIVVALIGLFFCFHGRPLVRVALALWGALIGFSIAASVTSQVTGQPLLAGTLDWVIAGLAAALCAGLAYAFYALGVLIAAGSVGAALGVTVASLVGLSGWLGAAAPYLGAALLVLIALAVNLANLLVVLISAVGGAAAFVQGLAMMLRRFDIGDYDGPGTMALAGWPLVVFAVLAVTGTVVQLRRQ